MSNLGIKKLACIQCLYFSLLNHFVHAHVLLYSSYRCRNTNAPGRSPWDRHAAWYLHNMGQVDDFIPTLAHL